MSFDINTLASIHC